MTGESVTEWSKRLLRAGFGSLCASDSRKCAGQRRPGSFVVDDGPDVRSAVADALTVERLPGHDRGRRAQQALSALARREPDAVVLDVMMPVLDGLAVCRRIRAIGDPHPSSSLTAPGLR